LCECLPAQPRRDVHLGPAVIDIMTKIMGSIVMALAIVLVTSGVGELWRGLMG
jgi:small neutral amino acid transporter SnatA (MarC family)